MKKRATFATRLGVIAATVGSSVGLGNIWRFPYETGQNGGAAFLLVYLLCIVVLGIPVMLSEFVVGREAGANVSRAFQKLSPGTKWHYIGYLGVLASVMIMGFYAVIAGWTLEYVFLSVKGFGDMDAGGFQQSFQTFTENPYMPLIWTFLFLIINYLILVRGVKDGIEKASNIMMPLLFLILLSFCIWSLFLPGASEGLYFLFHPDFSKINSGVVLRAMGQAFFSLSLGMGTLITYSSYFGKKTNLVKTAFTVAVLDSLVAILAGIIIFPAVFSYGISPSQGPELVFITLPAIFQQIPGGHFWSILFFVLLLVAALTSTISLCEVAIAFLHEEFGLIRKRATQFIVGICAVLTVFCSLSFGVLSDVQIAGRTVFDLFNFIASNWILPLGGMFIAIYVGWVLDKKLVYAGLSNDGQLKVRFFGAFLFCVRFVAPIAILLIFLSGLGLF